MQGMKHPEPGDWLRMTLDVGIVREGQVVRSTPVSMEVRWLGVDEPQVFPVIEYARFAYVAKPIRADQVRRAEHEGSMTPARAAARLGISLKRLRAMLREGALRGEQQDGRWVSVDPDSIDELGIAVSD